MENKKLNVCLHNVVEDDSQLSSIYDVTIAQLTKLIAVLVSLRENEYISSYEIFFDDGYKSFRRVAESCEFEVENRFVHAAVIAEQVGYENKLDNMDIVWLKDKGFTIDSHGVSHAALAVYSGDHLESTPSERKYRNMPYGKENILSEGEVLYQLQESAYMIEGITKTLPSNFVLPYGLYNSSTPILAAKFTNYQKIYTCDTAFDTGQYLVPRLLVTQENINDIDTIIRHLPNKDFISPNGLLTDTNLP